MKNFINGLRLKKCSEVIVYAVLAWAILSVVFMHLLNADISKAPEFISASNEPNAVLARTFGDCREGVISRSLLRFQAMMPRSLLRGISLTASFRGDIHFLIFSVSAGKMSGRRQLMSQGAIPCGLLRGIVLSVVSATNIS